jgi:hypothetical protein
MDVYEIKPPVHGETVPVLAMCVSNPDGLPISVKG